MSINLGEDRDVILGLFSEAVKKYAGLHARGKKANPVATRFDVLFDLGDGESTPFITVCIDSTPGSEPDGTWTAEHFVTAELPHWKDLVNGSTKVILLNGKKKTVDESSTYPVIGGQITELLKHARDTGLLKTLPKATHCELGVEEQNGGYGWPNYDDRGKENLL